ncbi:hypothetical protein EK21DRAFT_53081 [Setomelanomma holmii]|uniref:TNT domain-containing protein n=1 Tax=Setomelanomma holmii TaxID=210430 RepID=A0A9P4LUV9_9PLEO|nr:hypothetical protein EK21DRAFT_53081 [Setomelanomma holmii]
MNAQIDLQHHERCDQDFCAGTRNTSDPTYVCGDVRLGPAILPSCLPLTSVIDSISNYSRFGGLCPGEFLSTWTNYAAAGQGGWFFYPYADGFANNTAGQPIRGRLTLKPGMLVDRFGSASGTFVAPAGTPYNQRALPPVNLNFPPGNGMSVPYNYHVYEVKQPVVVLGGPVASWFGQPGFGTQFQLPSTIENLIRDRILEEEVVGEKCSVSHASEQGWTWSAKDGAMRLANGVTFDE